MKIDARNRPYTLIKTAISLDGYIDDQNSDRLILSNDEDKESVDYLKSCFDAILIGAQTIRKDNPSLLIKSEENRNRRLKNGFGENPCKVTLTVSGNIDGNTRFFQEGNIEKIVYCPQEIKNSLKNKLGNLATVVGLD